VDSSPVCNHHAPHTPVPGLPGATPRPDYIQAAVPFFFLLIVVELVVGTHRLTKGGRWGVQV
jgi:hypothetical protein